MPVERRRRRARQRLDVFERRLQLREQVHRRADRRRGSCGSSGARSAQRSRASCSRRAASSFASTAATSASTASGRLPPSAASRCVNATAAAARARGRRPSARAGSRAPSCASSATRYERSSASSVAIAVCASDARRRGPVGAAATALSRSIGGQRGGQQRRALGARVRRPARRVSTCSIASCGVGGGSSGSTIVGRIGERGQGQVEAAGRRATARRSAIASSSMRQHLADFGRAVVEVVLRPVGERPAARARRSRAAATGRRSCATSFSVDATSFDSAA